MGSFWFSVQDWHFNPRIYFVGFQDMAENVDCGEIARKLYEAVLEAIKPNQPLLLYTGVEEGNALHPVLSSLGFREFQRVYSPTLNVKAFDLLSLAEAEREFLELGYSIRTLDDLELTDALRRDLQHLFGEVYADTSTVVPATPERFPLDRWWKDVMEDDDIIPEAFFIAFLGEEMIGSANLLRGYLYPDSRGQELGTATFGTGRGYRHHHREIMLALKCREIAYAKAQGYNRIRAEIDAENPWIVQVCAELPFVQSNDYISMMRVLNWSHT